MNDPRYVVRELHDGRRYYEIINADRDEPMGEYFDLQGQAQDRADEMNAR